VGSLRLAIRIGIPLLGLLGALLWLRETPPAAAGLREWTPDDHDHSDEKEKVASGAQAAGPASGAPREDGNRVLIETTWRSQCAQCHGFVGHGDGPGGPALKATDLTKAEWQSSRSDPEIAASITQGKGRMPRFDLPPNVVTGLVARIRASKGR
jgi:mono/diheme cytochrome c family protein